MYLKTPEQIEAMAEGGRKLAEVLRLLRDAVAPGIKTIDLDRIARREIEARGAKPAFLHYRPAGARKAYPFTLCSSVNDVVVHGQPSQYALREGDIISLDLGLKYKGLYLDAAVTVPVGTVSREAQKLMAATEEALAAAIKVTKPGNTLGDVGAAIERVAKKNKFSVVDGLTGHGIGEQLHEDPTVFNVGRRGAGEPIEPGMVLAIEPMISAGAPAIRQLLDESYGTADHSLAAHFEHTVAVTGKGALILTKI